jgi:ketosteroid isomerase-like protein
MSDERRDEITKVMDSYVELREQIDAGNANWPDLARYYTDDAVYIDPAWGRVQGLDKIRHFFDESMRGLEDWKFPVDFYAISGDNIVVKWAQISPGTQADGSDFRQSGVSTIRYAGDGKFDYQEDLLNMTHVNEDLRAAKWQPGPGFVMPPRHPNRDWSRP